MSVHDLELHMRELLLLTSRMWEVVRFLVLFLSSVLCSFLVNAARAVTEAALDRIRNAGRAWPRFRNLLPRTWRPVRHALGSLASGLMTLGALFLLMA